jgi:hypothetical protein
MLDFPRIERNINLAEFDPAYAGHSLHVRVNLSRQHYNVLFLRRPADADYMAALADLFGLSPAGVEQAFYDYPPEVWEWLLITSAIGESDQQSGQGTVGAGIRWPRVKQEIDAYREERRKNSAGPPSTG